MVRLREARVPSSALRELFLVFAEDYVVTVQTFRGLHAVMTRGREGWRIGASLCANGIQAAIAELLAVNRSSDSYLAPARTLSSSHMSGARNHVPRWP